MAIRTLRLLALPFAALSMGTVLGHLLELPAKLQFDGPLWILLLQQLYVGFGTAGAVFEIGAVLLVAVLAVAVRRRHPAAGWTLTAALLLAAAHAAFWIWIAPVNAALQHVDPEAPPAAWQQLRDTWEWTHAARAVAQMLAFAALQLSVLLEIPTAARPAPR